MKAAESNQPLEGCELESVIATDQLEQRPVRHADLERERVVILALVQDLAKNPNSFFDKLVQAALELCTAESTGISLLDERQGRFAWPAIAGKLKCYLGEGTPREFGPCGTVLDRNCPLLFSRPQRHFAYLETVSPSLEEVLLIPFHIDGKAVGTIWAVSHDSATKFDAEDRRILEELSAFAAAAYRTLVNTGAINLTDAVSPKH